MNTNNKLQIKLKKYDELNSFLLERLMGDPKMTEYLGGPETKKKLNARHQKYLTIEGCYTIVDTKSGKSVGWIGNWEIIKNEEQAWETGFSVLPEYQGRGIATEAIKLLIRILKEGKFKFIYAFPHINNTPSNSICRKAGFTLIGEEEGEYPPGTIIKCNNWRFDLSES